ncbi:MAG: hypothetical protein KA765_18345 [Thermoflexales bacterium]|nr:hypothetical protein [Thermoflexales bacterium]
MISRKFKPIALISCLALLIAACGGGQSATTSPTKPTARPIVAPTQPTAIPVAAPTGAPTQPAATPDVNATGTITGYIQLQSPPTPSMALYAVDPATKVWVMIETQASDYLGTFSIEVPPGNYQLYARFLTEGWGYAGHVSETTGDLSTISVAANQTVGSVLLRMPGPSDCGLGFGLPASPDGRYPAMPGPDPVCVATQVAGYVFEPLPLAECQSLQASASQTLKFQFTLNPQGGFSDYRGLYGYGCTLTAVGTAADFADPGTVVADLAKAFTGWTEDPMGAANGPTGASISLTRNTDLMHIRANWWTKLGVNCPQDQPIAACPLTPEQKEYTVVVEVAKKK